MLGKSKVAWALIVAGLAAGCGNGGSVSPDADGLADAGKGQMTDAGHGGVDPQLDAGSVVEAPAADASLARTDAASPGCGAGEQDFDGDGLCQPACSAETCSGHGTCDDQTGVVVCSCDEHYAGERCAACGVGYQDDDANGECAPSCGLLNCSGHGACDQSSGTVTCSCGEGYAGDHCETCDEGFQDQDGDGTCRPSCTAETCSGHGTCDDSQGEARCECDEHYAGERCASCQPGYQDDDENGSCEPSCGLLSCSGHGSCDQSKGWVQCSCDVGHTGSDCSECATGFQDHDGDGQCHMACAVDTCSGHGTCDDATGLTVCVCEFGFNGASCTSCGTGFQDNDGNGQCALACSGTTCSGNGDCSDQSGAARCTCEAGHVGNDCSVCADGYQDDDGDGHCLPACGDDSCGDHAVCFDDGGEVECLCTAGYTGPECAECADGYQDHDDDGECEPACTDDSCAGVGTCDDASGSIVCACMAGYSGDECEYRIVYGLNIVNSSNWNDLADVPYDINNAASIGVFDRVAYRLDLDGKFVRVELDAISDDATQVGVPVDATFDQQVQNLSVSSNVIGVTELDNASGGSVEFWSHCYGNPPFSWDANDEMQEHRPDCYGQMAIYYNQEALFSYNRWSGNTIGDLGIGNAASQPDQAFSNTADDYTSKRLEVYVREVKTCSESTCAHGGICDDSSGLAVCSCADGYTGARCLQCAAGYNDDDHDGVCEPECDGGQCDGLDFAAGLPSGTYDVVTRGGTIPLYVDGSYDGGGWVLIGRGREGWDFTNQGRGVASDVASGLGTSGAFTPAYLSTAIVQKLMDQTFEAGVAATELDIRIKRAANVLGSEYQEVLWTLTADPLWNWQFPIRNQAITHTIGGSVLGAGLTATTAARDANSANNDWRRVFTYAFDGHDGKQGFSYGSTISSGRNLSSAFLWQFRSENHSIPYAEVYVRPRSCVSSGCGSHGSCGAVTGYGQCDCADGYAGRLCDACADGYLMQGGLCVPGCELTVCGAGETCVDVTGSAECKVALGTSCLDILTQSPTALDGSYVVDPDGAGSLPAVGVQCDMTGGGWTVISYESFDAGRSEGWSTGAVDRLSTCSTAYSRMLGGYSRFGAGASTEKTFSLHGVPHTQVGVNLSYYVLDSWDNESAIIRIDGSQAYKQAYTGSGSNVCGNTSSADRGAQALVLTQNHAADSVTVWFGTTLDEASENESFGIDDLKIRVR